MTITKQRPKYVLEWNGKALALKIACVRDWQPPLA